MSRRPARRVGTSPGEPLILARTSIALEPAEALGAALPLWSVLPFAALLASIAIFPLAAPRWWEKNRNRALVSAVLALPFAAGLALFRPAEGSHALLEAM